MKKNSAFCFYFKHWIALGGLVAFTFIVSFSSAQLPNVDSLKNTINNDIPDSQKVNVLITLSSSASCNDTLTKISYVDRADLLAKKILWDDGVVNAYICRGNIYIGCMSNYATALQYFLQAEALTKGINNKKNRFRVLRDVAFCYQEMGQHKQAIDYYRQELALNPEADEEMGIWGDLGVEYNSIGDYNRSISSYYSSLKMLNQLLRTKKTHELNDTVQMAALLLNIGDVYLAMSQPDKALENYDSAYKIGTKINNKKLQTLGLIDIAQTYKRKKNYSRSIELYQNALEGCRGQNDFTDQVNILNELANDYMESGNLPDAMDYVQRALMLAQDKSNEQLPKTYITTGKVLLQKKEYNVAVDYLHKGLAIFRKTGALDDEKEAWAALSNTYEQMNQPEAAFNAYRNYISIRDSIYNIDRANEFTRQELDFGYKNKELADKLNYDKRIAKQQVLTYSGYIALVLVLLIVFFVYRNYQTQKKYNELLSREQKRHLAHIEAQDHVLTDIANIQSHEIRGPVATILGLLQLYNYGEPADPINNKVMSGLREITEELDAVVKKVVAMENQLKREQIEADRNRI